MQEMNRIEGIMKNFWRTVIFIFIFFNTNLISQPKIIFETDMGGDADDLGALVMLNNFMNRGECELLAVMSWLHEEYAVSAIDAVNRYYNHPDIPIGVRKDEIYHDDWNYNKPIAEAFEHELTNDDVPSAVKLYRKILSEQTDSSVTIVTVGPLYNIKQLMESGPDSISSLSGKELISLKVKTFVTMGGEFPEGENEWNFNGYMPGVTKYFLENLEVPIVFSGHEVGRPIKTGEVFNNIEKNTPLYVGFQHFCKYAEWMQPYQGKIIDNSSYDQTAVLYAVRGGLGEYWVKEDNGHCVVDMEGNNKWIEGGNKNHSYLKLIKDPEKMAELIESIMLNKFD